MKALTLWQPWASAIALGHKKHETRSWSTRYRGPLLIHAALTMPADAQEFAARERVAGRSPAICPRGVFVALATLVDVLPAEDVAVETDAVDWMLGNFEQGRFAWRLKDVRALSEPLPARGHQGLWDASDEHVRACLEQIQRAEVRRG